MAGSQGGRDVGGGPSVRGSSAPRDGGGAPPDGCSDGWAATGRGWRRRRGGHPSTHRARDGRAARRRRPDEPLRSCATTALLKQRRLLRLLLLPLLRLLVPVARSLGHIPGHVQRTARNEGVAVVPVRRATAATAARRWELRARPAAR